GEIPYGRRVGADVDGGIKRIHVQIDHTRDVGSHVAHFPARQPRGLVGVAATRGRPAVGTIGAFVLDGRRIAIRLIARTVRGHVIVRVVVVVGVVGVGNGDRRRIGRVIRRARGGIAVFIHVSVFVAVANVVGRTAIATTIGIA